MTVVESAEAALLHIAEKGEHADLHDYDLEHVWRWTRGGGVVSPGIRWLSPPVSGAP